MPASHHAGRSLRSVNTASVAEAWPWRNKMQAGGTAFEQVLEASRLHSDAMHGRNELETHRPAAFRVTAQALGAIAHLGGGFALRACIALLISGETRD
ncbi:hypothetical protein [Methylobacterium sp. WL103]|uniref:hypothetical protein n=1 Tax=Methylobacterium sp. WL103 TaxID=2603891 RepID=UPI001AEDF59E|nr:hypothetical protein [Methylobacterium sp. WL103]